MRFIAIIALLLSGCAGVIPLGAMRYDLGPSTLASVPHADLLLRSVELRAPSWLASTAMQYRLAYGAVARREAYRDSRWAAPPAELLEHFLKRRMLADEARIQASGCRLRVELGEFVQVFSAPGSSDALLEINAALFAPRGDILLARHAFKKSVPAGADARAGAAAFAAATAELGDDLASWLAEQARETPDLIPRCRGSQ